MRAPTYRLSAILPLALVAALGGFLFGFDSGVINGAVNALSDEFGVAGVKTGLAVSLMLLGCAVGAFLAGTLADRFGRKPCMIATAVAFAISGMGSALAFGVGDFIFWRLLGGFAVGAASVLAPAYISEIAPAALRGRLASLQQLAIVGGLFVAFLSNYLIAHAAGDAGQPFWFGYRAWRWMLAVEVLPALIYLVGAGFVPESPRWLATHRRLDEARAIFVWLGESPDLAVAERKSDGSGELGRPRFADLMVPGTRRFLPIIWAGIRLSAFQQLVGINVVFYYGATLWEAVGFGESKAMMINVISGVVNIGSTLVAIALIDRIGRRPLLLAGSAGMAISLGTLAVVFAAAGVGESGTLQLGKGAGMTALLAANVFVFAFGVSWGPVVWVLLGEMFPNRIRGSGLAVAAAVQWVVNFFISTSFPVLLSNLGLGVAYTLYALAAVVSFVFVHRKIKETRGRTLEQM